MYSDSFDFIIGQMHLKKKTEKRLNRMYVVQFESSCNSSTWKQLSLGRVAKVMCLEDKCNVTTCLEVCEQFVI